MSKNRPFVVNCDMMCKQNDRKEADKMNLDIVGRIRKENEKRGWTVYRLAKEANLSPSTLTNMMHRGTCPSLTTIENVCEAYGITLAEFLYGQDDLIHLNTEQKRHLDREAAAGCRTFYRWIESDWMKCYGRNRISRVFETVVGS